MSNIQTTQRNLTKLIIEKCADVRIQTFGMKRPVLHIQSEVHAYLVGAALGDGNLSNPNGRAQRLRVICDDSYPSIRAEIMNALRIMLPNNRVSIVPRNDSCTEVSCYSNHLEALLGWKASGGSKIKQRVSIPNWILTEPSLCKACLRGLFQTDGSIYTDRGYVMANVTTVIPTLATGIIAALNTIGYTPTVAIVGNPFPNRLPKYVIRISKRTKQFIIDLQLEKVKCVN